MNGRIDILSDMPSYHKGHIQSTNAYDAVGKDIASTPVSDLFFSKTNIEALQTGIYNRVYNQSKGKFKVGKQDEIELKIIMRSIYFDSLRGGIMMSVPVSNDVVQKVRDLNKLVLDFAVPRIITNIEQYERYKVDVSKLPDPIDRPTSFSSAGTKVLEFKSFF
jgi:hypothetical protein